MPWRSASLADSGSLKLDWSSLQRYPSLDPYIVWHDLTGTASSSASTASSESVCALVEFSNEGQASDFWSNIKKLGIDGVTATHTGQFYPTAHRFTSLVLPRFSELKKLMPLLVKGNLQRLELVASRSGVLPGSQALVIAAVEQFKALPKSLPGAVETRGIGPEKPRSLAAQIEQQLSALASAGSIRAAAQPGEPLVVIVDDGFNFASNRVRTAGQPPRLHPMMWDQSPPEVQYGGGSVGRRYKSPFWEHAHDELGFIIPKPKPLKISLRVGALYGQRLMLERLFAAAAGEPDQAIYAMAGYLRETPAWTHGVSMLDLASNGTPRPDSSHGGVTHPGQPVLVQLPERTVDDTSGGSLAGHALDAIHHALYLAGERPVIVNLSYGTHSGPHDGTSMFERALEELLGKHKNLHVVLPAGNTHLARCHASCHVGTSPPVRTFQWKVMADDPTDSYLEIWLSSASALVRVTSPNGHVVQARAGSVHVLDENSVVQAALVYPKAVAQGQSGTMALLALAPTRRTEQSLPGSLSPLMSQSAQVSRKAVLAPHGVWTIEVENHEPHCTRVDLWVQRDDAAPGGRRARNGFRGRQSYLLETDGHCVEPRTSLSGIATLKCERLYVVGAMRLADSGISAYSAAGPNRDQPSRTEGPDVVVVADESRNLPGMLTHRTLGGGALRISGTSVAAARVTRMLFEHVSKNGSAAGFVWTEPTASSPPELHADGAPEPAAVFLRGEWKRMWEAGLHPPTCS